MVHQNTQILADSGYQGIEKIHAKSLIPKKKPKGKKLDKESKSFNKELSSKRIKIENVIGWIKKFKIIAEKYRNRRKRFGLRFNLISAIYNLELNHA